MLSIIAWSFRSFLKSIASDLLYDFSVYVVAYIAYVTRHRAITNGHESLSFSHSIISNYITFVSVARRRRLKPTFYVRRFLFFFIFLDQTCSSHICMFCVRYYYHNSRVRDVNIDEYRLSRTPTYTFVQYRSINHFFDV